MAKRKSSCDPLEATEKSGGPVWAHSFQTEYVLEFDFNSVPGKWSFVTRVPVGREQHGEGRLRISGDAIVSDLFHSSTFEYFYRLALLITYLNAANVTG